MSDSMDHPSIASWKWKSFTEKHPISWMAFFSGIIDFLFLFQGSSEDSFPLMSVLRWFLERHAEEALGSLVHEGSSLAHEGSFLFPYPHGCHLEMTSRAVDRGRKRRSEWTRRANERAVRMLLKEELGQRALPCPMALLASKKHSISHGHS